MLGFLQRDKPEYPKKNLSEQGDIRIEITSWKARAYGIFTRVGEVSEIERVGAQRTSEISDTKPTSVKIPYKGVSML